MPRSGVEPCLAAAQKAEAEAAKHRPTAEQKQARIAELKERARMFGDSVKQSAQAKVLERKWVRFLLVRGDKYGFSARKGPTVDISLCRPLPRTAGRSATARACMQGCG